MADTIYDYNASAETMRDEINFIEINAEEIVNRLIERFEEYSGEVLYPGDERRMFLQGFAYVLADVENHINETGRGNLLRYAEGLQLDEIGELYGNKRMMGNYATTTIEVTISQAQSTDLVLPQGTKVTPDGIHFFAFDEALIFPANDVVIARTVSATATETGDAHNGFIAGQIDKLVEKNEYVQKVKNTTTTSGGTDVESDEDYKERLRLAPFSFSVAGPAESYRYIAMSVSTDIEDVYVYSPTAGVVQIVITKTGGEIPDADDPILTQVLEACSDKNVRPLTDNVQVVPATAVDINVEVQYYIPNNDTSVIDSVTRSVNDYITWQTSKIGRDINPDYLNKLMVEAGAARVVINKPEYQALEKNQIAQIARTSITYAGSINM